MDWEESKKDHSIPRDVLRELSKSLLSCSKSFFEYVEQNKTEFKIGNKTYESFKGSYEKLDKFLRPLATEKLSKYKDIFREFSDNYHFMMNEIDKHKMPPEWDLHPFLKKIGEEKSKLSADLIADPRLENMKKITELRKIIKRIEKEHGKSSLN